MIKNKKDLHEYIEADRKNAGVFYSLNTLVFDIVYPNLIIKYLKYLRLIEYYNNLNSKFGYILSHILMIKLHKLSYKLGFYIPINVFDAGLYIPHFGSIVVHPNSRIGKNCILHANVVIGQHNGGTPTIGNNVFIGPGAKIFGEIYIADNTWIGANSVVNKDINELNTIVAGIPAKIVGHKEIAWVNTTTKG